MTVLLTAAQRQVEILAVAPDAQASTNTATAVAGSALDARPWRSVAYTIVGATQTIEWWVYGANAADFSDEVIVDGPADVAAAAVDSYAVAQAPYAYYRVKIKSKVNDVHGAALVRGLAKS
jgi:hypothetical protein